MTATSIVTSIIDAPQLELRLRPARLADAPALQHLIQQAVRILGGRITPPTGREFPQIYLWG